MNELEIAEQIDKEIISQLYGLPLKAYDLCMKSDYFSWAQDYANNVTIKRLGMNDHGKVHMRKVTNYAIAISKLLNENGVKFTGQTENWCTQEDSLITIILSSFVHDIGMSIHRQNHEYYTLLLVTQKIDAILNLLYQETDKEKKYGLKCLIIEAIAGHMGNQEIASIEAGVLMVADGCDLEFGRAKPSSNFTIKGRIGDIHHYSASCIQKVSIKKGDIKPIKILIHLKEYAGFFQIEEILMQKILKSTIKEFVEVVGFITEDNPKKYL